MSEVKYWNDWSIMDTRLALNIGLLIVNIVIFIILLTMRIRGRI